MKVPYAKFDFLEQQEYIMAELITTNTTTTEEEPPVLVEVVWDHWYDGLQHRDHVPYYHRAHKPWYDGLELN
jgi:hypothetical protein